MLNRIEHGDDVAAAEATAQQQLSDAMCEPHWLSISCSLAANGQMTVQETTVRMDEQAIKRAILQLTDLLVKKQEVPTLVPALPTADLGVIDENYSGPMGG